MTDGSAAAGLTECEGESEAALTEEGLDGGSTGGGCEDERFERVMRVEERLPRRPRPDSLISYRILHQYHFDPPNCASSIGLGPLIDRKSIHVTAIARIRTVH
jgi:hypothetical protein